MKKTVILFVVMFLNLSVFPQFIIENSGFETWTGSGGNENPVGWDSPNQETSMFMAFTVTKSTDAHTGTYSAKMTTTNVFVDVPGVLVNGNFVLDMGAGEVVIDGGVPFTERPLNFSGYYKYTPAGADSCYLVLGLFKRNTITGDRDTVGYAQFHQSVAVADWTYFDIDITYNSSEVPDSLLVILSSSNPESPVAGSTLYVDGLEVSGGTLGTYKLFSDRDFEVYPNPVADNLVINLKHPVTGTIRIYDVIGTQVHKQQVDRKTRIKADLSQLPQGLYFIELQTAGQKLTRKVFKN